MTTLIGKTAWRYFYLAWFVVVLYIGFVNTTNVIMEQLRTSYAVVLWRPIVNEYSGIFALFALLPLIRRFDHHFSFQRDNWKLPLLAHVLFTIPFAIVHSALFVAARKLIYPLFGAGYEFGHLGFELLYEYRKVTVGYILVVASLYAFRHYVQLRYLLALPEARGEQKPQATKTYLRRMITNRNDREVIVETGNIYFLETAGNYVIVHTAQGQFRLRSTLSNIEGRLDPADFVRVHRSYIVNIAAIKEIQPWFRGDQRLILRDGEMVNLSRRYRDNFAKSANLLMSQPENS